MDSYEYAYYLLLHEIIGLKFNSLLYVLSFGRNSGRAHYSYQHLDS